MISQFHSLAAANAAYYATQISAIHTAQSIALRLNGIARGVTPGVASAAGLLAHGASYRSVGRVLSCTAGIDRRHPATLPNRAHHEQKH